MSKLVDATVVEPLYAELARLRRTSVRDRARAAALSTLSWFSEQDGTIQRALARPRVHFVYLHHVFRDEEAGFRQHLRMLAAGHEFISHSEAVARVHEGRIDRPHVSFSFDDGFADNARAASVLEEFGATGCFFVCPGIVGERNPAALREFCGERPHFPATTPFLDWRQLEGLLQCGHEVGGHTMTHPDLGQASPDRASDEIARSYEEIRVRLGKAPHFAWPLGRWDNFSPAARDPVFRAGFETCASAVRGCTSQRRPDFWKISA